jgi:hypothetical protein
VTCAGDTLRFETILYGHAIERETAEQVMGRLASKSPDQLLVGVNAVDAEPAKKQARTRLERYAFRWAICDWRREAHSSHDQWAGRATWMGCPSPCHHGSCQEWCFQDLQRAGDNYPNEPKDGGVPVALI